MISFACWISEEGSVIDITGEQERGEKGFQTWLSPVYLAWWAREEELCLSVLLSLVIVVSHSYETCRHSESQPWRSFNVRITSTRCLTREDNDVFSHNQRATEWNSCLVCHSRITLPRKSHVHIHSLLMTSGHSKGNDKLVSLENLFKSLTMIITRQAILYWTIFSRHVSCVSFGISRVTWCFVQCLFLSPVRQPYSTPSSWPFGNFSVGFSYTNNSLATRWERGVHGLPQLSEKRNSHRWMSPSRSLLIFSLFRLYFSLHIMTDFASISFFSVFLFSHVPLAWEPHST